MRISDWSSDVCSSDLEEDRDRHENAHAEVLRTFDPQDRMSVQDEVAYGAAANAGHGSEKNETDDVHLIARGDQCACNREDHDAERSEEHTSELQSLMRISYAVFCLKKKTKRTTNRHNTKKRTTHPA